MWGISRNLEVKCGDTSHSHIRTVDFKFTVHEHFHTPKAVTDPMFIFIFKEVPPPCLDLKHGSFGLRRLGENSAKFVILLTCIFIASLRCTYLCLYMFTRHSLLCRIRKYVLIKRLIKRRKYRFLLSLVNKQAFIIHVAVPHVLLLLLICGDIHPHPGPVVPRSTRHPGSQLLNVASWNVRTLLDSKRVAARPTAIVAQELARYNIDIAALSETRVLGETVIEEPGGGYTFFLQGKPIGDKCYHGVGFAIRTKLVSILSV